MDIKDFIERLDATTNSVLQTVKNCTPGQLTFKQDNNWCVLEVLEHIYLTDRIIHTIVSRPSDDKSSSEEIIGDDKMKNILVEQRTSKKVSAPEILKPKGSIKDLDTFENIFLAQRKAFKEDIVAGNIIIDNRIHKHPLLNEMTIADWLNFTVHHTQRHIEQIKEIINNTGS